MARLLVNGAAQAVATFGIAWLIRHALTGTEVSDAANLPMATLGGLLLTGLVMSGLRVLERMDAERMGQDYVVKVRLRLFTRLASTPSRFNEQPRFGLTMTRMITDLNGLKKWVSIGIARMSVATITVLGCLAALAYFNVVVAATVAMLIALVVVGVWLLTPALRHRVRQARRRRGQLAGSLGEKLSAMATVAHFGRTRKEWRRLRTQSSRVSGAMVRRMQIAGMMRSIPDIAFPISVAVLLQLTITGHLTWGETVASFTLLAMIVSSLRDISRAWEYRVSFEEAHYRLVQVFSRPHIRKSKRPVKLAGAGPVSVELENVGIRASTLDSISARADSGARVLISGSSGSGKTALLALAARLFDPDRGRVLLDGIPMGRLSLSSVHHAVQLVSPTLPLLRGTVAENLAYGSPVDDPDWVAQVAEICRLGRVDQPLATKLNDPIEEKGQNLSDGLRARMALARALVARPRLLLIDDPAFSLDPEAKLALRQALAATDATVLIAALEDRAIAYDSIWRLENGRVTKTEPSAKTVPLTLIRRSEP